MASGNGNMSTVGDCAEQSRSWNAEDQPAYGRGIPSIPSTDDKDVYIRLIHVHMPRLTRLMSILAKRIKKANAAIILALRSASWGEDAGNCAEGLAKQPSDAETVKQDFGSGN